MKRLFWAACVAGCLGPMAADADETAVGFYKSADRDIQTQLIKQFPVGAFAPANSFGTQFMIRRAKPNATPPRYNLWDNPTGTPLRMHTSVPNATYVYTLMNAYHPAEGAKIATVTVKGTGGVEASFPLVAGTDIRDFCVDIWANTINGTTTQNAFQVEDVRGACGTGNVKTGYITTYHIDEQQLALPASFQGQTLTDIVIKGTKGNFPVVVGVSVVN